MLPFFFRLFNPAEANSTEEDPNRASDQTPTTPTQTTEIQGNTQELQQPQTPTTSPMPATPTRVPLLPIQAIIPDIALMMRLFGPVAPLRIIVRQTIEQPTQGSSENQTSTPSTEAPRHVREIMFIFPPSAFPPLPTEEQILNSLFNLQQPQGPPPASQQTIEKIPNITVTEEISSVQPRCSICCDDFMAGAEVAQLPCKHVFDRDCIVTWLKLHNTCPVCRFCVRGDEDKSKNEANPSVGENEGSREEENSGAVNLSANNDEDRATATNETQDNPKEVWEVESTNEIEKIKDDEMVIEEDLRRSTESNSTS